MKEDLNLKTSLGHSPGFPIKGHFSEPASVALRQGRNGNLNTKFLFLAFGSIETSQILRWLAFEIVGFKKIFISNH